MKTTCYCIYCPSHPLYKKTNLTPYVGWFIDEEIPKPYLEQGRIVNCLEPVGGDFEEFDLIPEEHTYQTTAYADGCAKTGFMFRGIAVRACCGENK